MRNTHKIFVAENEQMKPPAIPKRRWEDNIKMDITENISQGVSWIHLARDKVQWQDLVNTVTNFQFPLKAGNLFIN
jgi:hypothetical protein